MRYIGDLSKQDVETLIEYSQDSKRILEFGVGGSTQVLAQCATGKTEIISIDTDTGWIEKTKSNFKLLNIEKEVSFVDYNSWKEFAQGTFDFIFDDGVDYLRLPFALESWDKLEIGGFILFHDTRRQSDMRNVMELVTARHNEVDYVICNVNGSNITVVKKKALEPYVNWNIVEGREDWEWGYGEPPAELWENK
jgi:predicted O-methyltransferase YrrM